MRDDCWIPIKRRSVIRSFETLFDVRLKKLFHKQTICQWFQGPYRSWATLLCSGWIFLQKLQTIFASVVNIIYFYIKQSYKTSLCFICKFQSTVLALLSPWWQWPVDFHEIVNISRISHKEQSEAFPDILLKPLDVELVLYFLDPCLFATFKNKANLRDLIAATGLVILIFMIFLAVWPCSLTDDLEKQ